MMALALLLTACDAQQDERGTDAVPEAEATPSPEAPVSILRPDVEVPEAEVSEASATTPLDVVIGFPAGGDVLDAKAIAALKTLLETPQLASGGPITLRGHSDAGGSDAINQRVSLARAEAVRDWLIEQDVMPERIAVIAFGEQNPIEPNALPDGMPNEAGRAANRRVEVQIAGAAKQAAKPDE